MNAQTKLTDPAQLFLIGIAGPAEALNTQAGAVICQHFYAGLYDLDKPVSAACAAALGVSLPYFQDTDKTHFFPILNIHKCSFMREIRTIMQKQKASYLTDYLTAAMEMDAERGTAKNGHVVVNIRSNADAEWLRSQGGWMLHLDMPLLNIHEQDIWIQDATKMTLHSLIEDVGLRISGGKPFITATHVFENSSNRLQQGRFTA